MDDDNKRKQELYMKRKQELYMKIILMVERLDELEQEGIEEVNEKTHQKLKALYDEIISWIERSDKDAI